MAFYSEYAVLLGYYGTSWCRQPKNCLTNGFLQSTFHKYIAYGTIPLRSAILHWVCLKSKIHSQC